MKQGPCERKAGDRATRERVAALYKANMDELVTCIKTLHEVSAAPSCGGNGKPQIQQPCQLDLDQELCPRGDKLVFTAQLRTPQAQSVSVVATVRASICTRTARSHA